MSAGSLHSLFALLLTEEPACVSARDLARALAPRALGVALDRLETHKVLPLLAQRLEALGHLDALDPDHRARLLSARQRVRALNRVLFLSASLVLKHAQEEGAAPLVLKGLLLADSYYPDPAARPMGDFDLLAAPGGLGPLRGALARSGFARVSDHVAQDHAEAYANRLGVSCDVHAHLESYPALDWETSTRELTLRHVHGVTARTLEPNTMLAHLLDHLHGHGPESGLVLLWLVDIALVLRRHAGELDRDALRRLMSRPGVWVLLLRVLGLLEAHGVEIPGALRPLRASAARIPALSLSAVMRGRRTLPWGIPAPAGYLRVLAMRLSIRDYTGHAARSAPTLGDLCLSPLDALLTHLAEYAHFRV